VNGEFWKEPAVVTSYVGPTVSRRVSKSVMSVFDIRRQSF
jgi:hypothetical protein